MSQVRLAELCAATSMFTDLGTGQPPGHGLRTCVVAMRLAETLGLDADDRREVFYVALLRLLGCTAEAHQLADLSGGDEVSFLAGMAPVTMGSPREEMQRLIRLVATGRTLPQRLRALAGVLTDARGGERLLDAHCEVAAQLATTMGLSRGVTAALRVGYARWDGHGVPRGLAGPDIPISVRISVVARDLELWTREANAEIARQTLRRRRGRAYDPAVVDAALHVGQAALRDAQDDDGLWSLVVSSEPQPATVVTEAALLDALGALGDHADLKMPDRSGYARRVARLVSDAAPQTQLDARDTVTAVQAALVHDVGIVAVPVGLLRRNPQQGSTGWEHVRLHPLWSSRILTRCSGLETVATVAGRHHERRDGSGYPSGTVGDADPVSSLLACAVLFDEQVSKHRVHGMTAGHATAEAARELGRMVSAGALAERDVRAVLSAAGMPSARPAVDRPAGLTEREVDVLCLLARGHTNRQIAQRLGISVKTVGAHLEHVYSKAGVRSRAAATLFAVQHDLLG